MRILAHLALILGLSALTQLGGVAWALALLVRRRRLLVFAALYAGLSVSAVFIAPVFGRVPLPCAGAPLRVQSPLYCALNRHYVTPPLKSLAEAAAARMAQIAPGTVTLTLDGGFPFVDGFALLPHLSHDDGEKLDLALYYRDETGYQPGKTRAPLGYFAFETGPGACPPAIPTMRWDLAWLQPLWRDMSLDRDRTRALVQTVVDDPRTAKVFLEPALQDALGLSHPKLRFQGCRAARHDDHIHLQL